MKIKAKCPHCEGGMEIDVTEVKMQSQAETKKLDSHDDLLETLKELRKQIWAHHKMNVKKDFSLMTADAAASKAIYKAEGGI